MSWPCLLLCLMCCACTRPATIDLLPSSAYYKSWVEQGPLKCVPVPARTLRQVHGAAFNSRYMSVDPPDELDALRKLRQPTGKPVSTMASLPFYVEEDYHNMLSEKAAWLVPNAEGMAASKILPAGLNFEGEDVEVETRSPQRRTRAVPWSRTRRAKTDATPWSCQAQERWVDLGVDYFPRFLRTISCGGDRCWYGQFQCKPRAFTVRLLRRQGDCVDPSALKLKTGISGLPPELLDLWVWEERALPFCCECSSE